MADERMTMDKERWLKAVNDIQNLTALLAQRDAEIAEKDALLKMIANREHVSVPWLSDFERMQRLLASARQEIERLKAEGDETGEMFSELYHAIIDAEMPRETNERLLGIIGDNRFKTDNKENRIATLNARIAELEAESEARGIEREALRVKLSNKDARIEALEARKHKTREEYRLSDKDLDRIINECGSANDLSWAVTDLMDAHYEMGSIQQLQSRIDGLEKALKGRHDYGPASPAEQEFAWVDYCSRSGWEPNSHPSAKNAFVEGFCMGDMFSEGDETVGLLRKEIKDLVELLRECFPHTQFDGINEKLETDLSLRIAAAISKGEL